MTFVHTVWSSKSRMFWNVRATPRRQISSARSPAISTPASFTDPEGAPAPAELTGAGGAYLDIEFQDPHDGTTVRQRWSDSDLRWPVVSRTETTLSIRRG